jgi:hypothetical protein
MMHLLFRRFALCALLACLSSMAFAQGQPNMPPDNVGGRAAHLGYSAAMGAAGHLIWPEHSGWTTAGCVGIGIVKEYRDYRKGQPGYKHGLFSRNDIGADTIGCGIGLAGAAGVRLILRPNGFALSKEM